MPENGDWKLDTRIQKMIKTVITAMLEDDSGEKLKKFEDNLKESCHSLSFDTIFHPVCALHVFLN